ncbi:MAG: choice-of-anchor J domain-containing protein [Bacteroidales bacterium]|nr:choice-of-anchor J domain-containing protein [Bacteroidales bacterium]
MKKVFVILAAAWLVAACAPKEELKAPVKSQPKVFVASVEQTTRAYVDGTSVCWENDGSYADEISIFDKNDENICYVYSGTDGATSGSFTIDPNATPAGGNALSSVYSAYPYSDYHEAQEGVMLYWLNPNQSYAYDSFGICPMVAVSDNTDLEFKHICGFLRIPLLGVADSHFVSVEVQNNDDEAISGDIYVVPSADEAPELYLGLTQYAYSYVDASLPSGYIMPLNPTTAVNVWLAIPPTTFNNGITLTVTDYDGRSFKLTSSNKLEIKRGVCKTTAPVNVVYPERPADPDLTVVFRDFFEDQSKASGWTLIDSDGDSYGWEYAANAKDDDMTVLSGNGILYSMSYDFTAGALNPDNWAITPAIGFTAGNYLSFWVRAQDMSYPEEHYAVYISDKAPGSTITLSDWTLLHEATFPEGTPCQEYMEYQRYVLPIPSQFENSTGYIAFRHYNCTDQFILNIDEVSVTEGNPVPGAGLSSAKAAPKKAFKASSRVQKPSAADEHLWPVRSLGKKR